MREENFFRRTTVTRAVSFWGLVCLVAWLALSAAGREVFWAQDKTDKGTGQSDGKKASSTGAPRDAETMKKRLGEITSRGSETGNRETPDRSSDKQASAIIPEHPGGTLEDPAVREKYIAALREYYDYRISGYRHRQRVFGWQLLSAKIIFLVVLMLVFTGIYFAAIQFKRGLKEGEKTEFTASLKGISASSPVLGVIILAISLAFFYLYLVYVYPIAEVF